MAPATILNGSNDVDIVSLKNSVRTDISFVDDSNRDGAVSQFISALQEPTFAEVPLGPVDPDEVLLRKLRADTSPDKVDLVAGVYRNEKGNYHEFDVIRKAKKILAAKDLGHDYISIFGIQEFREEAQKLVFGEDSERLKKKQVASLQTIAGCGANRIGAAFLKHHFPNTFPPEGPSGNTVKVYIGTPGWRNHIPLFNHAGFEIETYRHYDPTTRRADFASLLRALRTAPEQSIFVLQACCHNPTGADFSRAEWETIAVEMQARRHFPFFDLSYAGFGPGSAAAADGGEADAWPIRHFAEERGMDLVVAQTFSKCMGLYGERLGCLHVACGSEAVAARVLDQARCVVRWEYSSPPAFAARLAAVVLRDRDLSAAWRAELASAAARVRRSRAELHRLLTGPLSTPGDWSCVLTGSGMFSFLPLSPAHVDLLADRFHVWMPDNGRMNVAGLTRENMGAVATAIDAVVRELGAVSE